MPPKPLPRSSTTGALGSLEGELEEEEEEEDGWSAELAVDPEDNWTAELEKELALEPTVGAGGLPAEGNLAATGAGCGGEKAAGVSILGVAAGVVLSVLLLGLLLALAGVVVAAVLLPVEPVVGLGTHCNGSDSTQSLHTEFVEREREGDKLQVDSKSGIQIMQVFVDGQLHPYTPTTGLHIDPPVHT